MIRALSSRSSVASILASICWAIGFGEGRAASSDYVLDLPAHQTIAYKIEFAVDYPGPIILEAGMLGRPVVASDVPGNRDLVAHKETGLLFEDDDDLSRCVLAIVRNRSVAGALGVRMREDFKRRFNVESEIDRLLSAYAAA